MKTKWREIIAVVVALLLISLVISSFATFDNTKPGDADAVYTWPASIRTNWDALETRFGADLTSKYTVNIKEPPYNAVGNGVADDTAAIQAALDAAGYVNLVFGAGGEPTLTGGEGKTILIPPGNYLVTDTLYYYPGQTIEGHGLQSWIDFQPTSTLKDLFAPKADVGLAGTNIFRTLYFEKLLLTSNSVYGNAGIHFENVMHWVVEDVMIRGFKYSVLNDGDSGRYYNRLIGVEMFDAEICFYNKGAVCHLEECITQPKESGGLWEATATYGIQVEAPSISIVNCGFEGDAITAHIYLKNISGASITGCYYEGSPLVLLGMERSGRTWGQTSITGNWGLPVLVKFEDLMNTPTAEDKYPHGISLGGNYRLLNLIANPSAKRGSMGWVATNGAITQSPDTFMSRFAWRVTADGAGSCSLSATTRFERPLGARLTVTFLAKVSHPETDGLSWSNLTTDILFRPYKVIDYGNGWILWAFNIENTDESFALTQVILSLADAVGGDPTAGHYMDISNIRIYEGEGFDIFPCDTESDIETLSDSAPSVGTWELAEKIWKITPAASGSPGWICTASGTFSTATDNTGDTDGSTATIIGMADTDDFYVGQYITTSAGFPNSVDASNLPVKIISKTSTTLVIDDTSDTSESNITVLTPDPVFKAMANLAA